MITESVSKKISMISEDIMQPLFGSNTESKKAKQYAAYKTFYRLVFTHPILLAAK
jgi:hypothetical protein